MNIQDLVSKNEALRRQLHEVQVHATQQIKRHTDAAQAEEDRRLQSYLKEMESAKQLYAEAMVSLCFYRLHLQHCYQFLTPGPAIALPGRLPAG